MSGLLVVNRFDSRCAECGKRCDPRQASHDVVLGSLGPQAGCGVTWTRVTSDYIGPGMEEATRALRPDLTWVDPLEAMGR